MLETMLDYLKNIFKKDSSNSPILIPRIGSSILREILQRSNQDEQVAFNDAYEWDIAVSQIDKFLSEEYWDIDISSEVIYLPGDGSGMIRVVLRRLENSENLLVKHVDVLPKGGEKEFEIKAFYQA